MAKTYRQGAIGALLDEYERAIADLHQTIADISDDELVKIVDGKTTDLRCRSVQTILSHVVSAGYNYALYIRQLPGEKINYTHDVFHPTIKDYSNDVNKFFAFTEETFKNINEDQLEQPDNDKKILTRWGQFYDIEQMAEHAIVHILRHRRQIKKFKIILRDQQ